MAISGLIVVVFMALSLLAYSLYQKSEMEQEGAMKSYKVLAGVESLQFALLSPKNDSEKSKPFPSLEATQATLLGRVDSLQKLFAENSLEQKTLESIAAQIRQESVFNQSSGDLIAANNSPNVRIGEDVQQLLKVAREQQLANFEQYRYYSKSRLLATITSYTLLCLLLLICVKRLALLQKKKEDAILKARQESERYSKLIERSGFVTAMVGLDGIFRYISKNAEEVLGPIADGLVGKPSTLLLPDENTWGLPTNPFMRSQDLKIRTKDKEEKWVSYRFFPVRDEGGKITDWQVIVWDNDVEKKMEEQLKALAQQRMQQHRLTQDIIDNIPSAVYIKDLDGRYMVVNKKLCEVFRKNPEELLAKRDADLFPENTSQNFRFTNEQVILHKSLVTYEDVVNMDGKKHYFWVVKFPLLNVHGEVQNICGLATDITERKENELELIHATRVAEKTRMAQETFLANMSHEIRTPMNGIMGMSHLLISTLQSEEQKDYAQNIMESARHLLAIINDVLDFSKIRSGKFRFERIPFHPRIAIKRAIVPLQFRADEKLITLEVKISDKVPETLLGDPLRLQQIMINLVGNALKFTVQGSVIIEVDCNSQKPEACELLVTVKDTGIGIAKNKQQMIFESFTQNNAQTSRKYGGTGLGLAIVKQLTELQKGKVWVKSNLGAGSTFSFSIPYPITDMPISLEDSTQSGNTPKVNMLQGIHLLVAEDNPINQKVVLHTLKRQAATADIVANGKLALDALSAGKYDAILMDLQMPEMDGYTTTRFIRNELKSDIPIIAMTADALKGEAERCFQSGMDGYISKPFEPNELYAEILKFTRLSKPNATSNYPEMQNSPLVDFSYLYELSGNDRSYISEVMNLFLGTMPEGLKLLASLIREKQDYEGIYRQAHFLKSSVSVVRVRKMYENLTSLESLAKSEAPIEEMMPLLNELEATFSAAFPILEAEQMGGSTSRKEYPNT